MKKLLGIIVLTLLLSESAYAKLALGSEWLSIISFPPEANCKIKNDKGNWNVVTPAIIKVKRSKKPLKVSCIKNNYKASQTFHFIEKKILDKRAKSNLGQAGTNAAIQSVINTNPLNYLIDLGAFTLNTAKKINGTYGTSRNDDGTATIEIHLKPMLE
tara:strand:+ start:28 stop:501 length:474 start_codon:yes stop_codon:yes gene_type:complete